MNKMIGSSNRRAVEPPWTEEYFGASYFGSPDRVLPRVASPSEELVIADLELDVLRGGEPSGWYLPRDRRPAIYRVTGG